MSKLINMNKEIKQRWITALTDGTYKQGRNQLRKTEDNITKYCCLGVLCDLANKEGVGEWKDEFGYDEVCGILPQSVMTWADLQSPYAIPCDNDNDLCLTVLNDTGRSFTYIADLIEKYL